MRLVNARALWILEGMLVHTIPAKEPIRKEFMNELFPGLQRSTDLYRRVASPSPFERSVLIKPNNSIVIVPMSPDVQVMTGEDIEGQEPA